MKIHARSYPFRSSIVMRPPNRWRFLLALLGALAAARVVAGATPEVKRIVEISSLSAEQAGRHEVATLRGTVTFVEPGMVFFQDDSAGTYFRPPVAISLSPGDRVEVTGETDP